MRVDKTKRRPLANRRRSTRLGRHCLSDCGLDRNPMKVAVAIGADPDPTENPDSLNL